MHGLKRAAVKQFEEIIQEVQGNKKEKDTIKYEKITQNHVRQYIKYY